MGFILPQSSLVLVTDTPVSRSLGAIFSELTGQPTPLELRVPIPTIVALVTRTTKMIPSSVASSEPPQAVTATAADVAPLTTVTPPESQAAPVTEQTLIASPSLLATEGQTTQSSGLEDNAAQFQISHRTSAPDSTSPVPLSDP